MLWIIVILLIYLFQIITIVFMEYRHPAKAVAWLLILFCFPLIGFIMYYFIAQEYSARRRIRTHEMSIDHTVEQQPKQHVVYQVNALHNVEMHGQERLFSLLSTLSSSPLTSCNQTEVLTNGHTAFEAMLTAIHGATQHIHMEFYMIHADGVGVMFQEALIAKAKAGVEVRIIADGVGSRELCPQYIRKCKAAGIEFHWFLPLTVSFYKRRLNYRNHRKMMIIDGKIGFTGGMNIGDDYIGLNDKHGFWRDTQLRIEGDAVYDLQAIFLHDWFFVSKKRVTASSLFPPHTCQNIEQVKMISSGPDVNQNAIQQLFFGVLNCAQNRVWMMTPYFIPDPSICLALTIAATSGIDVRIIIPSQSDFNIVDWATLSYVEELMQAGVRFFQYQKGFSHAKMFIMDQALASVGTANIDMRSFFSNFELNAVLFHQPTIARLEQDFQRDFADSIEINSEQFKQHLYWKKIRRALARLLAPLL